MRRDQDDPVKHLKIPASFRRTILDLFKDRGAAWLQDLPQLIAECEARWGLRVQEPFLLSYNYVTSAVDQDGEPVVLKLGVPNPELTCEIAALRIFNGCGFARLIDADAERGILLVERLLPGMMLVTLEDDEQATEIAAQLMKQLWQPAPVQHAFPTVAKWMQGLQRLRQRFEGGTGPFPRRQVEAAESLFRELAAQNKPPMLLHGDFHHYNILSSHRQPWLAIDPKGVVGDPAYEVGALLYNPWGDLVRLPQMPRLLSRRLDILSSVLGFDRQRLIGWGICQAVLSGWWSYEDHGRGWKYTFSIADILLGLD
jgi:streptomycin 6-kinase